MRSVPHRPKGSGYRYTIRVAARTDQAGFRFFLGRAMWEEMGSPAYVSIGYRFGHIIIAPGRMYRVVGVEFDGQPRFAVGQAVGEAIGLADGIYGAVTYPSGRVIVRF